MKRKLKLFRKEKAIHRQTPPRLQRSAIAARCGHHGVIGYLFAHGNAM